MIEHAPLLAIAIPILAAFATPIVSLLAGNKARQWFTLIALILIGVTVGAIALQVYSSGPMIYTMGAAEPGLSLPSGYTMPVRITLNIDAMSIFMAFITVIIPIIAVIYSSSFIKKAEHSLEKYSSLLLLMTAGMLGMFFTGDLFNLFVFLEILSIASCGLIAFRVERGEASEAAFKYLVVSAVAGLFVLLAAALFYGQYNALNISAIASVIQFGLIEKIALGLLVAGFAMKAGSVPMHMWVPDSYSEAPAPVTIMLMAASLAAVYALFRVTYTLMGASIPTELIGWILIILGVISMFVGATMALAQNDIKRLIAYQGISQTGYVFLGLGVGLVVLSDPTTFAQYGFQAMSGSMFQIINHALYEGLLFLTAGAIIYRVGTRNMDEMGGLAHKMPWTAVFFILGALAISGIPPMNGFASKFLIYESVYQFNPILAIIAMVVALITLANFVKVFHSAFMGPNLSKNQGVKEVPKTMLLGMTILALLVIVFSLFPDQVLTTIVEPAVNALVNQPEYINTIMGVGV